MLAYLLDADELHLLIPNDVYCPVSEAQSNRPLPATFSFERFIVITGNSADRFEACGFHRFDPSSQLQRDMSWNREQLFSNTDGKDDAIDQLH